MTAGAGSFLDGLAAAAEQAKAAEARFRYEAAQRIAALERERATAYRRLNLMRAIADAVAEMVGICVDCSAEAPNGQFSAAQFRDRLDNGRKVAIQILEFFDRHGVTIRRGDLRRINKHRLDLFRRTSEAPSEPSVTGRESSPVGRPDFNSGRGRETVLGGFDSLSLPPVSRSAR